jgi:hypothetical protein
MKGGNQYLMDCRLSRSSCRFSLINGGRALAEYSEKAEKPVTLHWEPLAELPRQFIEYL